MTFGQLSVYYMKNISLGNSYTKCEGETILRQFSEKSKLNKFLDQHSKNFCF